MEIKEAISENTVASDFRSDIPAWTKCDCCDDMMCNLHDEHAGDCSCPPIDVWSMFDRNPYDDPYLWIAGGPEPSPNGYPEVEWPEEY